MTTPEELGMIRPTGQDWVRDGDNAIATNALVTANIFDEQKEKNEVYDTYSSALLFKSPTPSGNVSTWTGRDKAGYYRVLLPAEVSAVVGRPAGAGPGTILVIDISMVTSNVTWQELGIGARTWDKTISTSALYATEWVQRPNPNKRVGTSLTLTGGTPSQVRTDFGGRLPINLGAKVDRWRVHLRNYDLAASNSYLGALNIVGLSIGEAALDANGEYTGGWVAGTQSNLNASGTTLESAHDWVSPFFDYKLDKDKAYMLSYGFTGAAGQEVAEGRGGGFTLVGSGAIHQTTPVAVREKSMPLQVWIEVEVADHTPIIGAVGDSLTVGHSATLPVHDSWLAKLARTKGAIPVFWAASGDTMANFSSTGAWKMHQWKEMSDPDVVYFALGSNDIFFAKSTLAQMKQRFFDCWLKLRDFTGANMVLCSIWPRFVGGAPEEGVRKQYNEWLETALPGGASYFIDTAAAVTNPDGSTLNEKWAASWYDIHLKSEGYARVAQFISGTTLPKDQRYTIDQSAGRVVKMWDYLNNREQLVYGDTGWRDVTALVGTQLASGTVRIKRDAQMVTLHVDLLKVTGTGVIDLPVIPDGFRPLRWFRHQLSLGEPVRVTSGGTLRLEAALPTDSFDGMISWPAEQPWPTALPGIAAGSILS